jgi:hypothetical protein
MQRWRGLASLVVDAVEHGSRAVEHIQKETARRPFAILERIPPIAAPARGVHLVHDAAVSGVHGAIRLVNQAAGAVIGAAIDVIELRRELAAREAATAGAPEKVEAPPRDGQESLTDDGVE